MALVKKGADRNTNSGGNNKPALSKYGVPLQPQKKWYELLIDPSVPWYQQVLKLKIEAAASASGGDDISKLEQEGKSYLDEDCKNFKGVREIGAEKSETRWIQTVLQSGTAADKIAAHTLLLQESTVHNLSSLRYLASLLDVKGRKECFTALDALLRLLTNGTILNPDAKLKKFSQQPVSSLKKLQGTQRQKLLALWAFESQLKDVYSQCVGALNGLLKDAVDETRRKGISFAASMLAYSPEQEQELLSRVVNKVGDPSRKVATYTVAQLERLLQQHPNMKTVIVVEVERLLYRPNINSRAQYYGLCFLSQLLLDHEDSDLAAKLIAIYISFFKACIKKGDINTKLMGALLTGVKRAYPYVSKGSDSATTGLGEQVNTLFKLVHMVQFNLAVQVLAILDQIVDSGQTSADRFYCVLYRKLLDPELSRSTRHSIFLNLLYRALKRDEAPSRVRAFIKRILQVALEQPVPLTCGLLYLVSELCRLRPELRRFQQPVPAGPLQESSDDEEEHYDDIPLDDQTVEGSKVSDGNGSDTKGPSWVHRKNLNPNRKQQEGYDMNHRNPLYARAEQSYGLWELTVLADHFHPTVALFARTILDGEAVTYTGDPLADFALHRFLDRFVFRNPKQVHEENVPAQRKILGKRKEYAPKGIRAMAVDSAEYMQQPAEHIPPEERFLYDYFKQRAIYKGEPSSKENDDMCSVNSDEFEDYLTKDARFADFAADAAAQTKTSKKKKAKDADEEESDASDLEDAEEDDDLDDDFNDDEFDDAFKEFDDMLESNQDGKDSSLPEMDQDDEMGFNEEDVSFSEGEEEPKPSKKPKRKTDEDLDDLDFAFGATKSKRKKLQLSGDSSNDFVAAEEFASLLEENAASGTDKTGTSEELANKDRANVKQLNWEVARDRWLKGTNGRPRKHNSTNNRPVKFGGNKKFRMKKK